MKFHFIVHESYEAPGAIVQWCEQNNHAMSFTRLHAGDILPSSIDDIDVLVVMGGPQSPATTKKECPHFDGEAEMELIRQAIDADKRVLGVCLGAQLLGNALGGSFEHSPQREIGVFDVTLTDEGKQDPFLKDFPEVFLCGHWHGDMVGLTPDSKVLATSKGCPRQIIRYTPKVYAFQCHFEFNKEAIEAMIANSQQELEEHKDKPYVWNEEKLRAYDYTPINELLFKFLDRFCN